MYPHVRPCTHTCTCMCRLCPSVPSYVIRVDKSLHLGDDTCHHFLSTSHTGFLSFPLSTPCDDAPQRPLCGTMPACWAEWGPSASLMCLPWWERQGGGDDNPFWRGQESLILCVPRPVPGLSMLATEVSEQMSLQCSKCSRSFSVTPRKLQPQSHQAVNTRGWCSLRPQQKRGSGPEVGGGVGGSWGRWRQENPRLSSH